MGPTKNMSSRANDVRPPRSRSPSREQPPRDRDRNEDDDTCSVMIENENRKEAETMPLTSELPEQADATDSEESGDDDSDSDDPGEQEKRENCRIAKDARDVVAELMRSVQEQQENAMRVDADQICVPSACVGAAMCIQAGALAKGDKVGEALDEAELSTDNSCITLEASHTLVDNLIAIRDDLVRDIEEMGVSCSESDSESE